MVPDALPPAPRAQRAGAWSLIALAMAFVALMGVPATAPAASDHGTSALGGAAEAAALVRCARSPSGTKLLGRPSACTIFGPGGSFAGGVNLARLRWVSWGGAVAVATGIEQGFHLPLEHVRVSVTLSGLRTCGGRRLYTRAHVTSGNGTTVAHPFGCAVTTFFASPSGRILCATGSALGDRSLVMFCQERGTNPYFGATISATGQVRRVANNGDPGATQFRPLPYGRAVTAPGVRCTSLETGMRCVGTRTGHGFLINLAGVHRF